METLLHLTSDTLDIYAAITFMSVLLKKKVRTPITIPFFIIYMVVLWLLEPVSCLNGIYSTVTDLARLRGLSMSRFLLTAV